MIKDQKFVAIINEDYIACVITPNGQTAIRTSNINYKKALEDSLNHTYNVPLVTAVPHKLYPTGKNSALEIAAALMAVSPATQIIQAPTEVFTELQKISGTTNNNIFIF